MNITLLFNPTDSKISRKAVSFLERFPKTKRRTNSLADIACPYCGRREHCQIEARTSVEVHAAGSDGAGATHWNARSLIKCSVCNRVGTVGTFTFAGLDELLAPYVD